MDSGWFRLYRKIIESPIYLNSTPEQCKILILILALANHEKSKWEWGGKEFIVEPGQFITSLESMTKKAGKGITMQNVRTALMRFEKLEFLTSKSTNTGRLITILNWHVYQADEVKPNKLINKDLTNAQQTPNKRLTTNKNDKNNKNERNNIYSVFDSYTDNKNLLESLYLFAEYRKEKKKELTETSVKTILDKLSKLASNDNEKIEILKQSIERGWQGIFPLKESKLQQAQIPQKGFNEQRRYNDEYFKKLEGAEHD